MASAFGVYIHIPYCIQRCSYCDFATYEQSQILPPEKYIELLVEELKQKYSYFPKQSIDTIYFGGGTPSLIPPKLIVSLIEELAKYGFKTRPDSEVTIEINPATISQESLKIYIDGGINRFSVGAQTFDNSLLKKIGREHNAKQTLATLEILRKHQLNFNFDILFGLPGQTLKGLANDIEIALDQGAKHLSPYCLTLKDGHFLNQKRPSDDVQVEMFNLIHHDLVRAGYERYEISNYAILGHESKHNLLYWTDAPYWGLGLSAHSYSKNTRWGTRFWNVNSIVEYEEQIKKMKGHVFSSPHEQLPSSQFEELSEPQSLTDFCHTSLRLSKGLDERQLVEKFSSESVHEVLSRLRRLIERQWVLRTDQGWALSSQGILLSNQVFLELVF